MEPGMVLDVNMLRNRAVVEACIARFETDGTSAAVAEMALFELTRHPDLWDPTVRGSLRLLASRPEAAVMTRASKVLGDVEEATGIPTVSVVAPALTHVFRALLSDIDSGGGADLQAFQRAVERYRKQLDHERHSADSLRTMQTLKAMTGVTLPREAVARIGRDLAQKDRASFRDFLQSHLLIAEQRNAHVRRGVSVESADALLQAPSVTYLFALAVGAIALEWVFKGGVEGAGPGRVANDILDIEYHIAGLWIGRLVSDDAGARARFEDLKVIGAAAWPAHSEWFDRAKALSPGEAISSLHAG